MNIPYDELALTIAYNELDKDILTEKLITKINNNAERLQSISKSISTDLGIPITELIQKSNYKEIKKDWINIVFDVILQELMNSGLKHKEAWSVIAKQLNVI